MPLFLDPIAPLLGVLVGEVVVQQKSSAGMQMAKKEDECLLILMARAAQGEPATDNDGHVLAREIEPMHRLVVKARLEALALGFLGAKSQHVRRDVGAVDVKPRPKERDEEPARAAGDVKSRLAKALDERPKESDLRSIGIESRPPAGHETVVPDLGITGHFP